jgi:hypothetical protein
MFKDYTMNKANIIPWTTDLVGAMVEYTPQPGRGLSGFGLSSGMQGIIIEGQWVSNYSVGTAFCARNVLWLGLGCSKDLGYSLAHFTSKDLKVVALPE